ncbi:MAG TPA: ATP-binding protein [Solirubrobacteraceae bacterium]|nr:ATP-binding protein [Solirubrobacteraceae bacterium]
MPRRLREADDRRLAFDGAATPVALCARSADLCIYEAVLPAVPICVGRVRRELDAALAGLDVDEDRRGDIALVVTEATTNVVLHAYGDREGPMYVAGSVANRSVGVTVSDCGRGMGEFTEHPGMGAGLGLIGRLADAIRVAGESPDGGTRVSAVFRRAAEPQALYELLHRGVAVREDADVLREYVDALMLGGMPGRDAVELLDEAQHALAFAKRLRRRAWAT